MKSPSSSNSSSTATVNTPPTKRTSTAPENPEFKYDEQYVEAHLERPLLPKTGDCLISHFFDRN
jgi:hypothetical protein